MSKPVLCFSPDYHKSFIWRIMSFWEAEWVWKIFVTCLWSLLYSHILLNVQVQGKNEFLCNSFTEAVHRSRFCLLPLFVISLPIYQRVLAAFSSSIDSDFHNMWVVTDSTSLSLQVCGCHLCPQVQVSGCMVTVSPCNSYHWLHSLLFTHFFPSTVNATSKYFMFLIGW